MINVLITGSNGQLASCIKDLAPNYNTINFIYTDYLELDICNFADVDAFFESKGNIDYCINCAAYTAVDKAETDIEKAFEINALGAKNLAKACSKNNAVLIHVSTDFVFEGNNSNPYSEIDETKPVSVYGESKLKGEEEIISVFNDYFIIRTAWLYSEHGNNFMKTMLRLAETRDEINVVSDQIGTPTYAKDLALIILNLIEEKNESFGLYHYSNEGVASWYDFAKAIFELSKTKIKTNPISTNEYPTPAKRPVFSVLKKDKILKTLKIEIPNWKNSLKACLINYNSVKQ